jgi:predicted hotdog family 3-hydroxylacyl-ACP dehydratase
MSSVPFPIQSTDVARLIPHSGDMMLLDTVEEAGPEHIVATARSHLSPTNPLRGEAGLGASAAMEYAAQAMAAHAALTGQDGPPRRGFIVVASGIRWTSPRLDTAGPVLRIEARRTASVGDGAQYSFEVTDRGAVSVTGTLTLSLESAAQT